MDARPSFFDFDVTKMMTDFRFRPFDVEALMACQRRNIEALSQANQLAVEGVQAVARRQIEIARQAVEDMSVLFRDLTQPVSTEDRIVKNTEYAKQMLEKSVNHGREITHAGGQSRRRGSRCPAQARLRKPRRAARDGKAPSRALIASAYSTGRPCRTAGRPFCIRSAASRLRVTSAGELGRADRPAAKSQA